MSSIFPAGLYGGHHDCDGRPDSWTFNGGGLTKRELFAAIVFAGIVSANPKGAEPEVVVQAAIVGADYLLAALAKEPAP